MIFYAEVVQPLFLGENFFLWFNELFDEAMTKLPALNHVVIIGCQNLISKQFEVKSLKLELLAIFIS